MGIFFLNYLIFLIINFIPILKSFLIIDETKVLKYNFFYKRNKVTKNLGWGRG